MKLEKSVLKKQIHRCIELALVYLMLIIVTIMARSCYIHKDRKLRIKKGTDWLSLGVPVKSTFIGKLPKFHYRADLQISSFGEEIKQQIIFPGIADC